MRESIVVKSIGDCLVVRELMSGDNDWDAEIVEQPSGSSGDRYRLRWRDGRETSLNG
jgi:hypothetical protein